MATYMNNNSNKTYLTNIENTGVQADDNDFFLTVSKTNVSTMLFGIIGNIICMCVLFQKPLLSRKFNWYLLILAFAEFLFCCIVFTNSIIYILIPPKMIFDVHLITCLFTDYIVNTIDAYCVFLTLILSIDRLHAIINPIKSKIFVTNRYPRRVIFLSFLILLILKSPDVILVQRYYKTALTTYEIIDNNQTNLSLITTTTGFMTSSTEIIDAGGPSPPYCASLENQNPKRKEAYVIVCGIILPLLLNIIPAILILISNIILSIYVKRYSHKPSNPIIKHTTHDQVRKQMSVTQKSHHFTIIIIGVWLLITSTPFYTLNTVIWISQLNIFQKSGLTFHSKNLLSIQAILSVFFNSNHCINIIIYLIFHKSFRYNSIKLFFKLTKLDMLLCNKYCCIDDNELYKMNGRSTSEQTNRVMLTNSKYYKQRKSCYNTTLLDTSTVYNEYSLSLCLPTSTSGSGNGVPGNQLGLSVRGRRPSHLNASDLTLNESYKNNFKNRLNKNNNYSSHLSLNKQESFKVKRNGSLKRTQKYNNTAPSFFSNLFANLFKYKKHNINKDVNKSNNNGKRSSMGTIDVIKNNSVNKLEFLPSKNEIDVDKSKVYDINAKYMVKTNSVTANLTSLNNIEYELTKKLISKSENKIDSNHWINNCKLCTDSFRYLDSLSTLSGASMLNQTPKQKKFDNKIGNMINDYEGNNVNKYDYDLFENDGNHNKKKINEFGVTNNMKLSKSEQFQSEKKNHSS